jgi:16S rRNA (cytosine967-C5)-methyltransferase
MTPAARLSATAELWSIIQKARVPMDAICGDYFRGRRYIGSKDRRDIVERVYTMMRYYARVGWWCDRVGLPDDARSRTLLTTIFIDGRDDIENLDSLYNGRQYHPENLNDSERKAVMACASQNIDHADMPKTIANECPDWAVDRLNRVFDDDNFSSQMQAMIPPATLDVRVNTIKSDTESVLQSLKKDDVEAVACRYSPTGLRLTGKAFLSKTKAFTKGLIEIQDEGSQLLAHICGAKAGMQVLDYCAGGGGKTLALAAMMQGKGRIVAMDIEGHRLAKSKPRLTRADVHNVELRPLDDDKHKKWLRRQKSNFDVVLVDAPCSSSGTWRRNPDLRWNHYGPSIEDIETIQGDILERVKNTVKIGGRLVYATCSLFREENEDQVEKFLANNSNYKLISTPKAWGDACLETPCPVEGDYLRLSPCDHQTDGFFAAVMERCDS